MIVRCPSCSARRDVPALEQVGAATVVECPECGHDWIEGLALPVLPQPSLALSAPPLPRPPDPGPLVDAARLARQQFKAARRARRLRCAAWATLLSVAAAPVAAVAAYPEQIVATIPASIAIYDRLGWPVNIYGLEIRQVDLQHLIVDGRRVIAVKGELANTSSSTRKIPWLRFGLLSKDNAEVYHWTLDTEIRPLKPGETTSFVTRLASPPEAARNVEIRFARADEIGSNIGP